MKTFALVPNSDSKGFSFLEGSKWDLKSMLSNTHSFLTKRKEKEKKVSHKCLYFAINRWLCNKSISNAIYGCFN